MKLLKRQNLKPNPILLKDNLFLDDAQKLEIEIIYFLRAYLKDKLTNILNGGQEMPNPPTGKNHWMSKPSIKRDKVIYRLRNQWYIPEQRNKLCKSMKGVKKSNTKNIKLAAIKRGSDPEYRKKLSKTMIENGSSRGKNNPMFGKKRLEVGELNKKLKSKPIIKFKNNVIVDEYGSCAEAARQNNLDRGNIGKCCYNNKTAGGFKWRYKSDITG